MLEDRNAPGSLLALENPFAEEIGQPPPEPELSGIVDTSSSENDSADTTNNPGFQLGDEPPSSTPVTTNDSADEQSSNESSSNSTFSDVFGDDSSVPLMFNPTSPGTDPEIAVANPTSGSGTSAVSGASLTGETNPATNPASTNNEAGGEQSVQSSPISTNNGAGGEQNVQSALSSESTASSESVEGEGGNPNPPSGNLLSGPPTVWISSIPMASQLSLRRGAMMPHSSSAAKVICRTLPMYIFSPSATLNGAPITEWKSKVSASSPMA